LDTRPALALALLVLSAALLVLISAAEAGVSAITRTRVRAGRSSGLSALLDSYIRQRQQILRALSAGSTITTVATTLALVALLLDAADLDGWRVLLAAGIAVAAVSALRESARTVALLAPEQTGLRLARPILALQAVLTPVAWVAAAPARALLRMLGRDTRAAEPNPAAELLAVLERSNGSEEAAPLSEERRMMRGILAMSEQSVREVMSPRTDIAAVSTDGSIGDVMKLINETGFSRIPLYAESIDHVVGVVYAKDLLAYLRSGELAPSLRAIARPPYFVPETKRVDELLSEMRRDQVHMAIAVDEYGGTAGLVTVEDLIEEIVGEIADEYDTEEREVERVAEDEFVVDARVSIDELNELFGATIASEDFDTVGGLVLSLLGRLASPGDEVVDEEHGLSFRVLSILGRRIKAVRVARLAREQSAAV
jgi:CBS domain containing-hemolysin-like protein